uniref:Probable protein-export membrane protein SecG n=1 Tax=Psammoneis obaidii TaxID=1706219 RepID=A0A2U9NRL5_9STRA|nr:preprotein translocase SecG subunit [Psammoneis obaidii]AWT39774.1 preprotein translocase SecG subunit [Psammoneis obaidii]
MVKQISVLISLFIIFIIFWRMPQQNIGLSSFANKSDLLGSPSSAQKFLNLITGISILIYFVCAIILNVT